MTTITADISSISRVPVLDTAGVNWLIFSSRFKLFAKSKVLWGHFDGTTPKPAPPAAQAEIDEWEKHEDEARNHLAQKLEDTTFLQADEKDTVADMWEWISNEFTALSAHVVASMQADFDNCNCGENGNVRTHLEALKLKHKGLVAVGVTLTDSQYATRIINSLPRAYQRYLSTITSSAKAALIATNIARSVAAAAQASGTAPAAGMTIASGNTASAQAITLAPAYLMHLAIEEWDRLEAEKKRKHANVPSKSREDTGVALNAQASSSSSSHKPRFGKSAAKGNGNQRPKGVCWNCGGKGHVQSKCPSPKLNGSEKGKGKQTASGSANAAVDDFDDDGAWCVEPVESIDRTESSALLRVAADTVFDVEDLFEAWDDIPELTLQSASSDSDIDVRVEEPRGDYLAVTFRTLTRIATQCRISRMWRKAMMKGILILISDAPTPLLMRPTTKRPTPLSLLSRASSRTSLPFRRRSFPPQTTSVFRRLRTFCLRPTSATLSSRLDALMMPVMCLLLATGSVASWMQVGILSAEYRKRRRGYTKCCMSPTAQTRSNECLPRRNFTVHSAIFPSRSPNTSS
ncbi:hypothetical protein C8J57DRAFT_1332544 [Mycena rebaudengoi]|nr:hypothetical protein C8J57DRAFT_1332544 [Mycena rebaudengoi]